MTLYASLPRPTIFAHRGACAHAPENTLAAFHLALRQKSDAIELDAKLSADGHIVIIHDQTVDRTTNGEGEVRCLSLEELKTLDAGQVYDQAFRGEKIPTLDEVFEEIGTQTFLNIELTNYASPTDSLPEKVAERIRDFSLDDRVLISSFNPIALRRFHQRAPHIPLGLLAWAGIAGAWARSPLGRWVPYQALHPATQDTNKRLIARKQRQGFRVHVYTVNHPDKMDQLFQWGVDGIFTDDPALARRTLEGETGK